MKRWGFRWLGMAMALVMVVGLSLPLYAGRVEAGILTPAGGAETEAQTEAVPETEVMPETEAVPETDPGSEEQTDFPTHILFDENGVFADWVITTYDEQGRPAQEVLKTTFGWYDGMCTYEYNDDGTSVKNYWNDDGVLEQITVFQEDGKPMSAIVRTPYGETVYTAVYMYGEEARSLFGDTYPQDFSAELRFDAGGNIYYAAAYDAETGALLDSEELDSTGAMGWKSYEYDEAGRLLDEYYELEGTESYYYGTAHYQYDEQGREVLRTELDQYGSVVSQRATTWNEDGSSQVDEVRFMDGLKYFSSTKEMDADGLMVHQISADGDGLPTYEEWYEFTDWGQPTYAHMVRFGENGEPAADEEYYYTYGEAGELLNMDYYNGGAHFMNYQISWEENYGAYLYESFSMSDGASVRTSLIGLDPEYGYLLHECYSFDEAGEEVYWKNSAYGAHGELLSYQEFENGEFVGEATFTYDENGVQIGGTGAEPVAPEPETQGPEETASHMEAVKASGVLKVGVEEYPPYDYLDENGEWVGFDAELARTFAEQWLGVEVEFVPMAFDELMIAVSNGTVDCAWNGIQATPEREEMVDFTSPYAADVVYLITTEDKADRDVCEDLAGMYLSVEAGSIGEYTCYAYDASVTYMSEPGSAIAGVTSGSVDGALLSEQQMQEAQDAGKLEGLAVIRLQPFTYSVAFPTGSDLVAACDEFMMAGDPELLKALGEEYGVSIP